MIKAVFFDLGGVIVDVHDKSFIDALVRVSPFSPQDFLVRARKFSAQKELEMGTISLKEFYEKTREYFYISMKFAEFEDKFTQVFSPRKSVIDVIEKIKDAVTVGVISDTSEAHFNRIVEQVEIIQQLPVIILSYREQIMKPDPAIFETAIHRANCDPQEAVFFDDKEENAKAAARIGMHGLLYTEKMDLLHELKKLGLDLPI